MLILTRRPAESVYIGEQVVLTVLGVVGNQVRFGIEAPRSITIDRAEIHERKKRAAMNDPNHPQNKAGNDNTQPAQEANGNVAIKCDGNHGGQPCGDRECWLLPEPSPNTLRLRNAQE